MKKENIYISLGIILIIGISIYIGSSITDVKKEFKEEEIKLLTEDVSANARKAIGSSKSSEVLIAQKIERTLRLMDKEIILQKLEKVEADAEFSSNRAVVLLYLAEAYQRINQAEQARKYYQEIITEYDNGPTYFYNMSEQRVALEDKFYIISLHEEASLNLALLERNQQQLQELSNSDKQYGDFKKIIFNYADLAKENILYLNQKKEPISSNERFETVELGKRLVRNMITSYQVGKEIEPFFENKSPDIVEVYKNVLQKVPTANKLEIEIDSINKTGFLYLYKYYLLEPRLEFDVYEQNRKSWIRSMKEASI